MQIVAITAAGSFFVGLLGAILGIGGGTFLVPYLVIAAGLEPVEAVGISLFCVIGTSVGGASQALRTGQANLGLALVLEPFMLVGSVGASLVAQRVSGAVILGLFAAMLFGLGALFLRLGLKDSGAPPVAPDGEGRLYDGASPEPDGSVVRYRPQRVGLLALLVSSTGAASGLLGIGGGVLNVPYMTLVSRVPLRAAASTSVLTMLVTGAAAGSVHLSHGTVPGPLVAASLLSVVPGGWLGARLQARLPTRTLRLLFAALAFAIAAATLHRALQGAP